MVHSRAALASTWRLGRGVGWAAPIGAKELVDPAGRVAANGVTRSSRGTVQSALLGGGGNATGGEGVCLRSWCVEAKTSIQGGLPHFHTPHPKRSWRHSLGAPSLEVPARRKLSKTQPLQDMKREPSVVVRLFTPPRPSWDSSYNGCEGQSQG